MSVLYDTKPWREFRAGIVERDGKCVLSDIAGECRGDLHVHHVTPISDGGALFPDQNGAVALCAAHHRMIDAFLKRRSQWKTCPHQHRSREARALCEAKLNRE